MAFRDLRWRIRGFRAVAVQGEATIQIAVHAHGLTPDEKRTIALDLCDALNQHGAGLTVRDLAVLAAVREYVAEHGIAPSRLEIAEPLGVTRPTVDASLERLAAAGLVVTHPNKPRAIVLADAVEGVEGIEGAAS